MNLSAWTRNRQKGVHKFRTQNSRFLNCRFHYCQTLIKHRGCVNALCFSKDDRLLFSGGDDQQVLIWNLTSSAAPTTLPSRHFSNIFCLSSDIYTERALSGGNDRIVICHDLKSETGIEIMKFAHAVHAADFTPTHNCIVVVVTEGGKLQLRDLRSRECTMEGLELGCCRGPMRSLSCHPNGEGLIATAGRGNGVVLFDVRSPGKCLMKLFNKRNQDFSGVKWSGNGCRIAALGHDGAYVSDICEPDKYIKLFDETYENKITVKNIEWVREDFVAAGSDNSSIYLQKSSSSKPSDQFILHGHRSVVNQVTYNKSFNLLGSSGVEKTIKLWSKFNQELFPRSRPIDSMVEIKSSSQETQTTSKRNIYIQRVMDAERNGRPLEDNSDEDEEIIAFFAALREETSVRNTGIEADGNSIVGTNRMANFHESSSDSDGYLDPSALEGIYGNESGSDLPDTEESSSSNSSGILEPLSVAESEQIAELERFDIARRIHLDRQRVIQSTGGSGPSASLHSPQISTSSESASESEDEKRKTRLANAKRKKRNH